MRIKRYPVVIEPTSTGYSAFSPDVPGCAAIGDTGEEARRNFRDALTAHFEAMRGIGEPIPEPRASVGYVQVATPPPNPNNVQEIQLTGWSDFEGALHEISREKQKRENKGGSLLRETLFRGLGNSDWGLETTLERSYPSERCDETMSLLKYYRKIITSKPAIETLGSTRWDRLPTFPEFEKLLANDTFRWLDMLLIQTPYIYEYLVYLRHHSFPSPLLDWTASPYVAAFFAFDSPPRQAQHVCIYAFLQDTDPSGSSDAHCFFVGPYMQAHPRHLVQQCRYSMCVANDLKNHDYLFRPHESGLHGAAGSKGVLFKITIPIGERLASLKHLELMNINEFSLFGSEDSLIHTVARREMLLLGWK